MKTRVYNGKEHIFCEWRRRYVRLTPEEYVRQQFLHQLVEKYAYPKELIAVEVVLDKVLNIKSSEPTAKRADAIVYDREMRPLVIIECKADTVALTQKTLDQATNYNRKVGVPYLILHNGLTTVIAKISEKDIRFAPMIPTYGEINRTEG